MPYEGSDKHKKPWQPGRKGSLCPPDMSVEEKERIFAASVRDGDCRYGTDGERAYCAHEHAPDRWHGYAVGWKEVPEPVRHDFLHRGLVKRSRIRKYWESDA